MIIQLVYAIQSYPTATIGSQLWAARPRPSYRAVKLTFLLPRALGSFAKPRKSMEELNLY